MKQNYIINNYILICLVLFFLKNLHAQEAYFDLSQNEIQIQTDFKGKEIIVFGVFNKDEDTIISIQGPKKDTRVLKKERILGFWFNTKRVIYKNIPTVFYIASSSPIKEILSNETIIKEKLYFDEVLINAITQRDFIEQKNLNDWNKNLINIKISEKLFKEYEFRNVDNKLFQARIFFPSNSVTGNYIITTYQVKDKIIKSKKNKIINIKKSGIGEKIYEFAHNQPATYGLLSIFFAILCGLTAATLFRRL